RAVEARRRQEGPVVQVPDERGSWTIEELVHDAGGARILARAVGLEFRAFGLVVHELGAPGPVLEVGRLAEPRPERLLEDAQGLEAEFSPRRSRMELGCVGPLP